MQKIRPEIAAAMSNEERIASGVDAQGNALPPANAGPVSIAVKPGFIAANKTWMSLVGTTILGAAAGYGAKTYMVSRDKTSA